mmetsp:Transcript_63507/g.160212  ORF Transcript_63507/g.160212 Transcript_63507/m.160212 type:complete len:630 (-) Transcript_63507:223-2112(-)
MGNTEVHAVRTLPLVAAACAGMVQGSILEMHVQKGGMFVGAGGFAHFGSFDPRQHTSASPANANCTTDVGIDASPRVLERSLDPLHVSWDVESQLGDWIGVFSPPDSTQWDYVDFIQPSKREQDVVMRLPNMRQDYEFRYYRAGACVGSARASFLNGMLEPVGAHLHLAGRSTQDMAVWLTWQSGSNANPAVVEWGLHTGNYTNRVVSDSAPRRYEASDMCSQPANIASPQHYIDVGYFHSVLLEDLPPDTTIYYRYGQDTVLSAEKSFRSPPQSHRNARWSFVAYGDQGAAAHMDGDIAGPSHIAWDNKTQALFGPQITNEGLQHVVSQRRGTDREPRMVVHFGDLAYAWSCGLTWELWQSQIEPIATRMPYMVSVGNHEYDHFGGDDKDPSTSTPFRPTWGNYGSDSGGECGVPMLNRFPHAPPTGHSIWWYTFSFANVQFVALSSEHDYMRGSEQWRWLEQTLKDVDRRAFPWLVVTSHRSLYNSERNASDQIVDHRVSETMRQMLEPLLVTYKVNLVLTGHYHSYERTCPVINQTCEREAPVHICGGMAGMGPDSDGWMEPKPEWSLFQDEKNWGFLDISVEGDESMTVRYLGGHEAGQGVNELDRVVLRPYAAHAKSTVAVEYV